MEDSHRMFLQAIMSCGIFNARDVKNYHRLACEKNNEQYNAEDLGRFVATINSNINMFGLEIKKAVKELTGKHYFVLVNKIDSDITCLNSSYTVAEMELFKKLVAEIFQSDSGLISSMEALALTGSIDQRISQSDAEKFYKQLIHDRWLIETTDGRYSLSARTLIDLEPYLMEQIENVQKCPLCRKICLIGQRCPECDCKAHFHCVSVSVKRQKGGDKSSVRCPSETCRASWNRLEDAPCEVKRVKHEGRFCELDGGSTSFFSPTQASPHKS